MMNDNKARLRKATKLLTGILMLLYQQRLIKIGELASTEPTLALREDIETVLAEDLGNIQDLERVLLYIHEAKISYRDGMLIRITTLANTTRPTDEIKKVLGDNGVAILFGEE